MNQSIKTKPKAKSGIEGIKLYTPGETAGLESGARKLSSNENLYGPSPRVVEAITNAAPELWKYPNVDHRELREAIAKTHNLPVDQLICGVGSDEILYLIAQAYAGEGDEVITTEHGFEIYGIVTNAVGAKEIIAKERARRVDVDAILQAISTRTRIIYIANPANPTGTILPQNELECLARSVPENVILVIDSAYAEFADDYDGGASLVEGRENIVMTRTLSKLYGLGGLRVGWAYGPQTIIDNLNRIRGPFNLSSLALAGARAAIEDRDYTQKCREKIVQDREILRERLLGAGLQIDESATNFLLVRFENQKKAEAARVFMKENGFLLRSVAHYGIGEGLRITVGTKEDVEAVARLLTEFMER